MVLIALIVSGLALLAAGVCLCLLAQEKKRNHERNAAEKELREKINWCITAIGDETVHRVEACNRFAERIAGLEQRIDPEAIGKAAEEIVAQAVNEICGKMNEAYFSNDFNANLGSILGFDPYASLEAQRRKERGEG